MLGRTNVGGGAARKTIPFDIWSKFTSQGLTSSGWTSDDGTKTVTRNAGTWTVNNGKLIADGSTRYTIQAPNSYMMYGIKCSVDPSFTPRTSNYWYQQSCLIGRELSDTQRDDGITIVSYDGAIYPCIGYSTTSYVRASKPLTLGVDHELFLLYVGYGYFLYMDGELVANAYYVASGSQITVLGVFWNDSVTNTMVKGTISSIGVWTFNGDIAGQLPTL